MLEEIILELVESDNNELCEGCIAQPNSELCRYLGNSCVFSEIGTRHKINQIWVIRS